MLIHAEMIQKLIDNLEERITCMVNASRHGVQGVKMDCIPAYESELNRLRKQLAIVTATN